MHELQTGPASVTGEAAVIRAADKQRADLQAGPAVLCGTITVVRAGTGKVETFDFVGTPESPATKE